MIAEAMLSFGIISTFSHDLVVIILYQVQGMTAKHDQMIIAPLLIEPVM